VSRTVRNIVHKTAYKGERGYPVIVEPERFDAVHAGLKRLDPVTLAKRAAAASPGTTPTSCAVWRSAAPAGRRCTPAGRP
jgi:hypothetical protein